MRNNLGVDPEEWFDDHYLPENGDPPDLAPSSYEPPHPYDSWPTANGNNRWAPEAKRAELESNPRPEEEIADWFAENPDESDEIEKEKTMHEKMYEIATARYNPFSLGGSENCDSDISCNLGGSEQAQNK